MARIGDVMTLRVVAVRPRETVQVAIARMLEENVGSVAVCEDGRLVGIFTERDVLRLAGQEGGIGEALLEDVMTRRPVTVTPEDDVVDAARLMGERRIRHLPVVQDGNVCGVIGIRDVLRTLVERLWREHDPAAHDRARELLRRG
ncbi:MAG: CBS domain-containing protein [Thermoleophilia bacterium]|nr:CBS domain-containing protein [Thermoleophilia bacterium]